MMSKRVLTTLFLLMIGSVLTLSYGQERAKAYFLTGEYDAAQKEFQKSLATNPAEAHYYLGEIAYIKGDASKAKEHYIKGLESSADYVLNEVGLGKIALQTDTKVADGHFSKAIGKNKKNVEVIIAVARAYYANDMMADTEKRLADARKVNRRSPIVYTFSGDLLRAQKKDGEAAGEYEQAVNQDPNYLPSYVKLYQIYQDNISIGSEWLHMLLDIDPDYMMAYKYMGDMFYKGGMFKTALESYNKFFQTDLYTMNDLTRYAASLYFSEELENAQKVIDRGLADKPDNFILNRLSMYSALDTEQYSQGVQRAEKFFSLDRVEEFQTIAKDHITYGKLLAGNKELLLGIEELRKAIEMDPKAVDVYKDISSIYVEMGDMINGSLEYQKFIDNAPAETLTSLDFLYLGRNYYMTASTGILAVAELDKRIADGEQGLEKTREESLEMAHKCIESAVEAFTEVETRSEDSHLGPLYRARALSLLDPTTIKGLAKDDYEKTARMLTEKEDAAGQNNPVLLEAYQYLAYYYYMQYEEAGHKAADREQTVTYCEKLKELLPGHPIAQQLLDAI